jgi:hypothetical protein
MIEYMLARVVIIAPVVIDFCRVHPLPGSVSRAEERKLLKTMKCMLYVEAKKIKILSPKLPKKLILSSKGRVP